MIRRQLRDRVNALNGAALVMGLPKLWVFFQLANDYQCAPLADDEIEWLATSMGLSVAKAREIWHKLAPIVAFKPDPGDWMDFMQQQSYSDLDERVRQAEKRSGFNGSYATEAQREMHDRLRERMNAFNRHSNTQRPPPNGAPIHLTPHLQVLGLNGWPIKHADGKKQYRELVMKHHPDKGGSNEQFMKIQKAWEAVETHLVA